MNIEEFAILQDGDVVKLRGGIRQGPCVAFIPEKGHVQFAYETGDGHISMATLPHWALEVVSTHPQPKNVPRDTIDPSVVPVRSRNRVR